MNELEPERYELSENPAYDFPLDRRVFLEVAGIVISLASSKVAAQPSGNKGRIQIAADGTVTVFTGKVEFGQGARTEVAMAVAEELGVPFEKVQVVLGDTDLCPNDGITAGSRTTPSTIPEVRKAAAISRNADVKALSEWSVLGKPHHHQAGVAIVTGAHKFPSDMERPGMLYGAVLRPPAYGATLSAIEIKPVPGLTAFRDGNFVACVAPTSYAAREAVARLADTAKWDRKPHPPSSRLYAVLKETAKRPREQNRGDVHAAMQNAARRHQAFYHVPFIQHAPMEPRAAVAEWNDGRLTVWTGTQNPFGVKQQLQQAFHLGPEKVRVIVPDTGGGFGGKHTGEVAIEAARMAKEAGKPVSLRWTRAEEFQWAYFRPAGLFEISAGIDEEGRLQAWDFANYNAGTAALETPYRVANSRTRFFTCDSPLREGSYRGIAATANHFARECFMDELASVAGLDPVEFRLRNIENSRLRDVLIAAANESAWSRRRKERPAGSGIGIACGTEKGSYVAACVEVETTKADVRIRKFHMAYECGTILNPSNLHAQVEGAIIQGLGGALTEEIVFSDGQLENGSFSKYRVPRFRDVPPITITLLNRKDLPSVGAGETPIVAVAPAIAAALFDATGERSRAMPVRRRKPF
jgi:isoquinoline 1-oxidoreductase